MNLGVVGSRNFDDRDLMYEILDIFEPFILISGGARGADSMALDYAIQHGYEHHIHLSDWAEFGRSTGFIRNRFIVEDSDLVLAFWNGQSHGTKATIKICEKLGVPVEIIDYPSLKV